MRAALESGESNEAASPAQPPNMKYLQASLFALNAFHNSTRVKDERKLTAYEETNVKQDAQILAFFKATHESRPQGWTSYELEGEEQFKGWFRESIRGALTNNGYDFYNREGTLYQTYERRDSARSGRGCYVWKYKPYKSSI